MSVVLAGMLFVTACSGGHKSGEWDNIDYSKIRQPVPENDTGYVQPTVVGCTDDDLYNCNN